MKKLIKRVTAVLLATAVMISMLPVLSLFAEEHSYSYIDDPPWIRIDELRFETQSRSIKVCVNYRYEHSFFETPIKFCMYAYNQQTEQWCLVGGWQNYNTFWWEPDANNNYTIVVYAGYVYPGTENIIPIDSCWQEVSRPQMGIQVTGDCAVPTQEGLLYGCTSNINPIAADASDYCTTCYIWSHDRQAWITQASYRASNSAWYRTAELPKGVYMMYSCTEELMPGGQKRKLSCRYYLFRIS